MTGRDLTVDGDPARVSLARGPAPAAVRRGSGDRTTPNTTPIRAAATRVRAI
jgi:hypothetical protein